MKIIARKCDCASFDKAKCKCPVLKMPLFAAVPDAVWEGFCKNRVTNDYRKGNIIFYEGNRPFGIYFLCSGRVKIVKTDSSSNSGISRIVEAPDMLGDRAFLANESYLGTGEALEDSRICFLDGAYFEKFFLEIPQVCRAILRRVARELGKSEEHQLDLGFKTVRGRLAKYIVGKAAGKSGACEVNFPETRSDLAKILGTSPEVLCRLLSEFRKKGWIAVDGRTVLVKDKPRLEQVSRR